MTAWKLDIHSRIKKHFIEICRTIKETVYRFEWTIEFKPLDYRSFAEIYPDSGRSRQTWARTISGEYLCSHIMPLEAVTLTMLRLTSLNMGCVGQGRAGTGQSLWIDGLICTVRSINASFPFAVNALPLLMRWYSHQCISRVSDKLKFHVKSIWNETTEEAYQQNYIQNRSIRSLRFVMTRRSSFCSGFKRKFAKFSKNKFDTKIFKFILYPNWNDRPTKKRIYHMELANA